MKSSFRSTRLFRYILALAVAASLWSTASIVRAAPPKTPTPTPAANADDEDEKPDPSTIPLPGTVIQRPGDKGYLSLTLQGGSLNISFYDKNKQPVVADVARARAHWQPKQQHEEENAILNPTSDGQSLQGNRFVAPPFPVRISLTLLSDKDGVVETESVLFKP